MPASYARCCCYTVTRDLRGTYCAGSNRLPSTVDKAPYDKNDDRAYDRTNKSSTLIWPVPADCLAEKGGKERPNYPKDGRQNEAGGLLGTRVKPFSNKTRKEPDYGYPKIVQHVNPARRAPFPSLFDNQPVCNP